MNSRMRAVPSFVIRQQVVHVLEQLVQVLLLLQGACLRQQLGHGARGTSGSSSSSTCW